VLNLLDLPEPESSALLACPFCGCSARLIVGEYPDFAGTGVVRHHYSVECSSPPAMKCSMGKHWLNDSQSEAVAAWNRRELSEK
jgi:hypothetical protein